MEIVWTTIRKTCPRQGARPAWAETLRSTVFRLLYPALLVPAASWSQMIGPATGSPSRYSSGPQYSASMGSVTVGDEQLYRISLRPDIPLGKWGLAFDLELFIDEKGNFSDKGWTFGSGSETLDSILRKIYYVRYGQPEDFLFSKIGALDRVTLGYGLVMDRYRNTLQYPGTKKTGVRFQTRSWPLGVSIEGMINNLQDFQQGGALIGARAARDVVGKLEGGLTFVIDLDQYSGLLDRDNDGYPDAVDAFPKDAAAVLDNDGDGAPDQIDVDDDNDGLLDIDEESGLPSGAIPVLEELERSYPDSFMVDKDVSRKRPFNKDRVGGDRFAIVGFDAGYPIVEHGPFNLLLYGQIAAMLDDDDALSDAEAEKQGVVAGNRKAGGVGLTVPGLWLRAGPVDCQLEFRHFRDDFDSGYFDNLYELDRARIDLATGKATPKDSQLRRGQSLSGGFGRLQTDIYRVLNAYVDYQHLGGAGHPKRQLHLAARLSPQLLRTIPRISRAQVFFQKNNIGARLDQEGTPGSRDGFFEPTEDTFYGYLLGMKMSGGVSAVTETRFMFERSADGTLERRKVMTIETVFKF